MAKITVEIDDERLAEVKHLLHTEDDRETVAKAVNIAIGAIHQRRAARQRLSELAGEGGAFGEPRSAWQPAVPDVGGTTGVEQGTGRGSRQRVRGDRAVPLPDRSSPQSD